MSEQQIRLTSFCSTSSRRCVQAFWARQREGQSCAGVRQPRLPSSHRLDLVRPGGRHPQCMYPDAYLSVNTSQSIKRAWNYHSNSPMVVSFPYLLLDAPLSSPSSTVPATNMRSRAPRTGPVWPSTTWTSRATPETTSAPGWMKSARPSTPSTCACAAAGPPCGPSWESWPRSSYWWPSSSSTRRGESPMRSTMVRTGCSLVS